MARGEVVRFLRVVADVLMQSILESIKLESASGRVGARAHFSASEPWLFKRAPAVFIILSLGTLRHTDASTHICECTAALVDRGERGLASRCWFCSSVTMLDDNS